MVNIKLYYFYDTNALLTLGEEILTNDKFLLSSVTLQELENIKNNKNKSDDIRFKARNLCRILAKNTHKYNIYVYGAKEKELLNQLGLDDTPDNRICACAAAASAELPIVFVTQDLCCRLIGENIFDLETSYLFDDPLKSDKYTGFVDLMLSEEKMAYFYSHLNENIYNLLPNQYIIIRNLDNEVVDAYRWANDKYNPLFKKPVKSLYFDKLKAKDIYQSCAIDALMNCTLTAISGKAGSGKSLLALMAAMYLIDSGKYDRLIVMFNPTKTRGSSDMGYYSGSFIDKAMQNSIGQILTTKFGDRYVVDTLLQQEKIKLISMADARGMEIKDNEIMWITEAQNTSVDLIKLCLSRVSSGAKVFIEGDYTSQTDSYAFDGDNNGLHRVITRFKGQEDFGYIQLQNVWRSKLAELCELL